MIITIIILILFLLSISLIIHTKKEKFTSINGTITVNKTINIKTDEKQVIDIDVADGIIRLSNYTGRLCKDRGLCLESDLIETMTPKQWREEQNKLNKQRIDEHKAIKKQQSDDKKVLDRLRALYTQLVKRQKKIDKLENKIFANKSVQNSNKYKKEIGYLKHQRKVLEYRIQQVNKYMNYLQSDKHPFNIKMKKEVDKITTEWEKERDKYLKKSLFNEFQKYIETFFNNKSKDDNVPPYKRYTANVEIKYNVKVNNNATYEEIIDNISQSQYSVSCEDMDFFDNFDIAVCIGNSCQKYDIGNSVIEKKHNNDDIMVTSIVLSPRSSGN